MQSVLQYRRLRAQVERQYRRHIEQQEKPTDPSFPGNDSEERRYDRRPSSTSTVSCSKQLNYLKPAESKKDATFPGTTLLSSGPSNHWNGREEALEAQQMQDEVKNSLDICFRYPSHGARTLSRTATVRSFGTRLGVALTGIVVHDRRTDKDEVNVGQMFVVGFEGDNDVMKPHNWSYTKRMCATVMIAAIAFVVGAASSIDSLAVSKAAQEFGVSEVTEILATGLYLVGFGIGALFAGPFSETVGRNPVYIITLTIYMIFIMASGLARNIQQQLVFRFFAGFFGSTPLTCAGGSISDLWTPMERTFAFPVFANGGFLGPVIGPVMGGFIAQSDVVSWRWVEWTSLIMSGLVLAFVLIFQPETYAPILLKWKAQSLREITADDRFVADVEIHGQPFRKRLAVALHRPLLLTFREPIIVLIMVYLTVIYIVLFTFLDGYNYIFGSIHDTSMGITGLCFLSIAIGLFGASLWVPLLYKWAKRDIKAIKERGGSRLPPEFRLWHAMLGAPAIPISLFWMGWTSYASISLWSPLMAGVLFGYGVLCVFISSYQYIIDSYEIYAASALTSITLVRYVTAGGMTVVGIPFYSNLGVHWTLTILGGISALLVPIPYLLYIYGEKVRALSKYAVVHDEGTPDM